MNPRRKSGADPNAGAIEMQELPPRTQIVEGRRTRSGSFDGSALLRESWDVIGKADFHYSATRSELEVTHIRSDVGGGGATMMRIVEERARHLKAQHMFTATSRPGFFMKQGFDYTDAQKQVNALKEQEDPGRLARDENNRGHQGGGGYAMFKPL